MKLTDENKAIIDNKTHQELLAGVRFSPVGDPWFQGGTGDYWLKRLKELREEDGGSERHTKASKSLGW